VFVQREGWGSAGGVPLFDFDDAFFRKEGVSDESILLLSNEAARSSDEASRYEDSRGELCDGFLLFGSCLCSFRHDSILSSVVFPMPGILPRSRKNLSSSS